MANELLIDIGSTFIKYGVYDTASQELILESKVTFPAPNVDDGVVYHVPCGEIEARIREIFDSAAELPCKKAWISVQMHGYVLRDAQGSFGDYVSWRDRSGNSADPAWDSFDFEAMGTGRKDNLPLVKLAGREGGGEFYTLGSYVAYLLTGKNATHITDACPSGFFLAEDGRPNGYAAAFSMPTVYRAMLPIGSYRGILIYPPVGDHQVSFLGSGAGREGYLVNIGTATQISCVDRARTGEENARLEKRPYFARGTRLYTVSGLIGGAELFGGGREEAFFAQLSEVIGLLPAKKTVYFGGGGAAQVFDALQKRLEERFGVSCQLIQKNIGMEGLMMLAEQNKIKTGTMLSEITFSNFPVIAKKSGLDFMIIDCEHGYFDPSSVAELTVKANLVGLDSIVRVGDPSRGNLTRLADMGVHGFLLPMTNTAEDIAEVVRYTKYAPEGQRGVSTTRAHTLYQPPPLAEYMKTANEAMKVYAQIETRAGVENVEEILAVEGVSGLFVGPNDLSVDLGCLGDRAPLYACIERVAAAAQRADKPWGIITGDKNLIAHAKANGATMISCGSELNMLLNGCRDVKKTVDGQ